MSDYSTDHSSFKTQSSNSIFFSDMEIINCLSEINNQFNFQDFYDHSCNNNFAVPNTFPEDKCSPFLSPTDIQKMNPAIRVHLGSSSETFGINQKLGRGKRKGGEGDQHRGKGVAHVSAKRGQATDSHSLAERVRRGKINDRLRCLQGIVPGCYKTMGMAVMLDEIINYVQSLQNQVEFLSMKLTVASSYYDFNSEADEVEAMQRAQAFGKQSDCQTQSLMRSHPQTSSSPTRDI